MGKIRVGSAVMNTCTCGDTASCSAILTCCSPPKKVVYNTDQKEG